MKRTHRLGIAAGLGVSLALASNAPSPNEHEVKPDCPAVSYDDTDRVTEHAPNTTKADRLIGSFGAFVLGVLDRKCRDGEATTTTQGNEVAYDLHHNSYSLLGKTAYSLTLTAQMSADGMLHAEGIHAFGLRKDIPEFSGADTSIHSEDVGTGWLVSVEQPMDPDRYWSYSFTGNTGASIAGNQASDIVVLGESVVDGVLGG